MVRSAWKVVRRRRGGTTWTGRGERRESAPRAGSRVSRCWMAGALCAGTWRREAHDEPAPPDKRGGVTAGHRPGPRSSETAQKELGAIAWFGADEDGLKRPWKGSVHVFPPLDRVPAFALKVLDELAAGRVTRAALLAPFDLTDSWLDRALAHDRLRVVVIENGRRQYPFGGTTDTWTPAYRMALYVFGIESPLPACSPSSASGGTSCSPTGTPERRPWRRLRSRRGRLVRAAGRRDGSRVAEGQAWPAVTFCGRWTPAASHCPRAAVPCASRS